MNLNNSQKLEIKNGYLMVDGKTFIVEYPKEMVVGVEDNKLVTVYRSNLLNYWEPEDITGHYA